MTALLPQVRAGLEPSGEHRPGLRQWLQTPSSPQFPKHCNEIQFNDHSEGKEEMGCIQRALCHLMGMCRTEKLQALRIQSKALYFLILERECPAF